MSRMLKYHIVDAFTTNVFSGNPAAVVLLPEHNALDTSTMQLIAREFNLSETAFVAGLLDNTAGSFGLRWFTPHAEVSICGHATLAAAHVLFASLSPDVSCIHFQTLSGVLNASKLSISERQSWIALEFPAGLTTPADAELAVRTERAVGRALGDDVEHEMVYAGVGSGVSYASYMLIELAAPFDLARAEVNAGAFLALAPSYEVIVLTTSPSPSDADADFDYVARVFDPTSGVPEDPVTGSAHCLLAPYWSQKLRTRRSHSSESHSESEAQHPGDLNDENGKVRMHAKQVSARGGVVDVVWDAEKGTCTLKGAAVTVAEGVMYY